MLLERQKHMKNYNSEIEKITKKSMKIAQLLLTSAPKVPKVRQTVFFGDFKKMPPKNLIIGLCWTMLDYVGLCWIMLDYVGLCWVMLDYVGLCWAMLDYVGLCWAMLGYVGL